jgi:hypothetical protein
LLGGLSCSLLSCLQLAVLSCWFVSAMACADCRLDYASVSNSRVSLKVSLKTLETTALLVFRCAGVTQCFAASWHSRDSTGLSSGWGVRTEDCSCETRHHVHAACASTCLVLCVCSSLTFLMLQHGVPWHGRLCCRNAHADYMAAWRIWSHKDPLRLNMSRSAVVLDCCTGPLGQVVWHSSALW